MFSLKNKVALVTGARRGIGRAIALALAEAGAKVVVTDIDEKECEAVVKEIEKLGISPIDCLHLASAEAANVDYFITCDYDLIRKYKGSLKVINPIDFIKIFKLK